MALPVALDPGDPGHIGHHEELHTLLGDVVATGFTETGRFGGGLFGDRPAAGRLGSWYLATDVGAFGTLYFDTGSAWRNVVADFATGLEVDLVADDVSRLVVPCARVGRTTNRTIATGASWSTGIGWNEESGGNFYDNDGIHDNVSNTDRLTSTKDGFWRGGAHINWAADSVGQRGVRIRKWPDDVILAQEDRAASGGADSQNLADEFELEAGDWIEIEVFQTSGGNLDIVSSRSHAFLSFIGNE